MALCCNVVTKCDLGVGGGRGRCSGRGYSVVVKDDMRYLFPLCLSHTATLLLTDI